MASPMKRSLFGFRKEIVVLEYERGLLYREGKMEKVLEPGRYVFGRREPVDITKVSLRQMSHILAGQEILTSDRIEVRITLIAQFRVTDPVKAIHSVESYVDQLYQEIQMALRDVVATRSLDQVLDERQAMGDELLQRAAEVAANYGVEVARVGIRDIILPREMRLIMMQEIEAERTGRADLIRARHEVAAARARANTAKILTENPDVRRLQEIDALINLAGKEGNVVILPNLAELLVPHQNGDKSDGAA